MSQAPCFMYIITVDPPNVFLVPREVKKKKNVSDDTQLFGLMASIPSWFSLAPKC